MLENEHQNVPAETVQPETKQEKFERERISRRAALKKMGVTSAMSLFALFSVDEVARMVGKAMKQREGDSKIADQIAREFRQAGVALADGSGSNFKPTCHTDPATGYCTGSCKRGQSCVHSVGGGCSCQVLIA